MIEAMKNKLKKTSGQKATEISTDEKINHTFYLALGTAGEVGI